jgi:hypothetical protein
VIIVAFLFVGYWIKEWISFLDIVFLTLAFCLVNITFIAIFYTGQTKDSHSQASYTLAGITAKFLIELFIALAWFLIGKKTSIPSVLLFFVLYLSFTLISISMILKSLRNKSL